MRLVAFGERGTEQAGVLTTTGIVPVSALDPALPRSIRHLLAGNHLPQVRERLSIWHGAPIPTDTVRLGPPITDPGKIVCVGLNYRDHAAEYGATLPDRPLLFAKAATALAGPTDPIALPPGDGGPDYEVELAVIIGRRCKQVATTDAMAMIAGYCIANDVTCRRWQKSDGQWFRAKSPDTFFPCGPALVTADEITDVTALRLTTTIAGERLQAGTTADLVHDIPALIAWISATMTLEPGDIISTGTPAGVGCYRKPPRFLQPGDVVECAITGGDVDLGCLRNPVLAAIG